MTALAEGCLKKGKGEEALVELQVYAWTVITRPNYSDYCTGFKKNALPLAKSGTSIKFPSWAARKKYLLQASEMQTRLLLAAFIW